MSRLRLQNLMFLFLLLLYCNPVINFINPKSTQIFSGVIKTGVKGVADAMPNMYVNSPLVPKDQVNNTSGDHLPGYPKYLLYTGKKKKGGCDQSVYLTPAHPTVNFSLSDHVYKLSDKSCSWTFRALEGCRVALSCSEINLLKPCDQEFIKIVDGAKGSLKICGGSHASLASIGAPGNLRDLYIRYYASQGSFPKPTGSKLFRCSASCSMPNQKLNSLEEKKMIKSNTKCYCGTKLGETRIVGGQKVNSTNIPWLASIVKANSRQSSCAASVINSRYILTASHCISKNFINRTRMQVVFNGQQFDPIPKVEPGVEIPIKTYSQENLNKLDRGNGSMRFSVSKIIYHPQNVIKRNDFDVALLKLDGEAPLGQNIRPICLPKLGDYDSSFAGAMAQIAGYGTTKQLDSAQPYLNTATVRVMSPEECEQYFSQEKDKRVVRWRMMCAGFEEGGVDTCQGDSGGPLALERNNVWTQIGIVSWGDGCGDKKSPGIYFRTTEIVQWIHYVVDKDSKMESNEKKERTTWCLAPE